MYECMLLYLSLCVYMQIVAWGGCERAEQRGATVLKAGGCRTLLQ